MMLSKLEVAFCRCALLGMLVTSLATANDSSNLVLNYRFDAGSGTLIDDSGSWKLNGALNGVGSSWADGKWGQSISLTGAGDSVTLDAANSNVLNKPHLTVTAWIRKDPATAGVQTIISNYIAGAGGYALSLDADTATLDAVAYINGAAVTAWGNTVVADNTWTHVALTYDGSDLRMYVDGAEQADVQHAPGTIDASTAIVTIGADLIGGIDELQIYSRGLTAAEIAANHAAVAGESDLVFYEAFDNFSTAVDNGVIVEAGAVSAATTPRGNGMLLDADTVISFPVAGNFNMDKGSITFWLQPNWDGDDGGTHPLLQIIDPDQTEFIISKVAWGDADYVWASNNDAPLSKPFGAAVASSNMNPNPVESWAAGEWHFIEVHWDSTRSRPFMVLAIDGVNMEIQRPEMNSGVIPAARFFLGAADLASSIDGVIDDLRIYSSPQFDADSPYQRYIEMTRNDGIWQDHETPADSPDASILDASVAPGEDIIFFHKPAYVTVFESTQPQAGDVRSSMSYQAARGETLSLFFNVHTRVELGDTVVSIDNDVLSNGGNTLPANPAAPQETLDIRAVRNWWQAGPADWSPRTTTWGEYMPELLVNDDTVVVDTNNWDGGARDSGDGVLVPADDDLPSFDMGTPLVVDAKANLRQHASKQFVITVEIPANASPGTYTTNVSLEAQGYSADLPITLEVLDFELAANDKETMLYHRAVVDQASCYHSTYSGNKYTPTEWCNELVKPEIYQAEIDDMAAHGINGVVNFNYAADLQAARDQVQQLIDAGIDRRITYLQTFPAEPRGRYSEEVAQALHEQYLTPSFHGFDEPGFQNQLSAHLQALEYAHSMEIENPQNPGTWINANAEIVSAIFPNVAACLRDGGVNSDPLGGCESQAVLDNLLPTHHWIEVEPPTCTTTNANGDEICTPPYYPQIDVESIQTEENSPANRQYYEDLMHGLVTPPADQIYYWQSRAEDPRINRYYAGIFLYLTNVQGWMPYVYQHFGRDTHPYNDYPNRFNMMTYPSQDGPVATMQWEALRDGLNDYRYLLTWRSLHQQIASLHPSLAASSAANIDAVMAKYKLGRWSMMENIDIAQFSIDREIVQQEILSLLVSDFDRDGLTNVQERELGTNPRRRDTDGDWLTDAYEVNVLGTNPNAADSDGDYIPDFQEAYYGLDPTSAADGMGDLDGDGVSNTYEYLHGTDINDALSVPDFIGNYFESFETAALPPEWGTPAHSKQDWTQNCSKYYGFDGNCSRQAGKLKKMTGDSVLSFTGNFRPGTLTVTMSYFTTGSVLIYVDGIRVMERKGFGLWVPFEINLSMGSHEILFVHRNPDGSKGGTVIIDALNYHEVTDLYSAAANARFCADVQQFLADTWLTPVLTVEPDYPAFVGSTATPWPEAPGFFPGNDEPLTVRQLTTLGQNPNAGGAEFTQLISCKTKRFDALNFMFAPTDVAAPVGRACRDVNIQTFERVIAAMTPAEVLLITGTGDPDDIQRPVFDPDKSGFTDEWIYDIAYMSGGDLHIESRELNAELAPLTSAVDPQFSGVQNCHLIAPEYARGLLLGEIPVIDNGQPGRF